MRKLAEISISVKNVSRKHKNLDGCHAKGICKAVILEPEHTNKTDKSAGGPVDKIIRFYYMPGTIARLSERDLKDSQIQKIFNLKNDRIKPLEKDSQDNIVAWEYINYIPVAEYKSSSSLSEIVGNVSFLLQLYLGDGYSGTIERLRYTIGNKEMIFRDVYDYITNIVSSLSNS